MKLIFHLETLEFNQTIREWWKHTDHFRKIIQILDRYGFWKTMTHAGIYGLKPFCSTEDFIEKTQQWKQGNYTAQQALEDTDFIIEFGLYPEFDMTISITGDQIKKINQDIIPAMINLSCDVHDTFREHGKLGPIIYIREHEVPFPQIKPPRLLRSWSPNSIVDIINPDFFPMLADRNEGITVEKLKLLATAPMPEGCAREIRSGFIIHRWVDDIFDIEEIRTGKMKRNRWLYEVLDPPVDERFK
jgi:hypothetical protein